MKEKTVSVALAAYNGQKYIADQMESILHQLNPTDELIVSLDFSTDQTEKIVLERAKNDSRVHVIPGPNKGVIKNFENAIAYTQNDIIFLADQDDYWLPGKVKRVLKEFEDQSVQVVMHDASIVDEKMVIKEPSYFSYRHVKLGVRENMIRNSYIGCCMAFKSNLKERIIPFPKRIPMHDQWIGLIGELEGKNILIPEVYLLYRRHEDNKTDMKHAGIRQMIRWRKDLFYEIEKYKKYRLNKG